MNQEDMRKVIYGWIDVERARQDRKWGEARGRGLTNEYWLTILTEEVGEAAKDVLDDAKDNLVGELIQVAAVAVAWLECLTDD